MFVHWNWSQPALQACPTETQQVPTKTPTWWVLVGRLVGVSEGSRGPKPTGLGMVSFSKFNLPKLQIVANRFNLLRATDSTPPAGAPVAIGFKLLQSVADPKKRRGVISPNFTAKALLVPAADRVWVA